MPYLLDACSLLAIFNDESGGQKTLDLIEQAKAGSISLFMSIIQLLEVYYNCLYVFGEEDAELVIESIFSEPITIIETISYPVMYEAGRFKTSYSMSLADSIAAATAKILGAVLVTKDDEIRAAEKAGEFSVLWLK